MRIKNKIANLSFDSTNNDEIYTAVNELFKDKSAQFGAFVYTLAIEDMEKLYKEKNIPHEILIATINELALSINQKYIESNEWGFDSYSWLIHHLRGKMFRLGRLVFEIAYFTEWHLQPDESKPDLKLGNPILHVHIPGDGKLEESACHESFEIAKEFFPKVLNFDFKAFWCCTWLFDPAFEKFLQSDSNIIKFRKLFTIFKYFEYDDGFGNAFGHLYITKENIKDAPTDTRLRKGIVEHILSGGIMQCGGGFRLI
ncbi:MAG: acyltransferase domain-containing protein [Oscillospiraceae bacterium]|nr:acyltransferase domain-containing protein [Oscillospiraceae bacterium]